MYFIESGSFTSSLETCLFCVSSGLIVGFILKFLIFGISSLWTMFRDIAKGGDLHG